MLPKSYWAGLIIGGALFLAGSITASISEEGPHSWLNLAGSGVAVAGILIFFLGAAPLIFGKQKR